MLRGGFEHLFGSMKVRSGQPFAPRWISLVMAGLVAVSLAGCKAQARSETPSAPVEERAEAVTDAVPPETLNIDEFRSSFVEDFDGNFSVSSWGCVTDWIAHTPWRGDFGDAAFADPVKGFPFTVGNGALSIEARRMGDGTWMSGMLSGRDVCNSGWSQLYGYFEIRAKLPEAPGFWPAFWLIGVNPNNSGTAEIDIFEAHTSSPESFTTGILKHPGVSDMEKRVVGTGHEVESGLLSRQFNTYGVEVDPVETVFYFNREEIFRAPTESEFRQPFFMLVSLAVLTGEMTEATPDSVTMEVDYIRAYQRSATP